MSKSLLSLCGIVLAACLVAGCASSTPAVPVEPGEGESLVIIQRTSSFFGAAVKWDIYVDGEKKGQLKNGGELRLAIPNGEHTLSGVPAGGITLSYHGAYTDDTLGAQALSLNSVSISFRAYTSQTVDRSTLQDVVFIAFEKTGESPLVN